MLSHDSNLSKVDFNICLLKDVIEESEKKVCKKYSSIFLKKAIENGIDKKKKEIYQLLGIITSFKLNLEMSDQPFEPISLVLYHSRSATIDDIYPRYLKILTEVIYDIDDPELRARIGDIIWVKERNHKMAIMAVDAYIDSFNTLLDPHYWFICVPRIERALQLSIYVGRKNEQYKKVIQTLEDTVDKYNSSDEYFLSAKLMELLLLERKGDSQKYVALSEKMAKRFEEDSNWRLAREYWKICANWCKIENNSKKIREKLSSRAETYVKQADEELFSEKPSYIKVSHHIQEAIEAYREVGKSSDRIEELLKMLVEYQEKSSDEMITIQSEPIDISEQVERAINQVKGLDLYQAIFKLANITLLPKVDHLKKRVEENAGKYIFQHLLSQVAVNETGKTVGRVPHMLSDDPKEIEAAKKAEMYKSAVSYQNFSVQACIGPARRQILLEHDIRISDFLEIVSDNYFIPYERIELYAKGLYEGLRGDFAVSTHLLIPQLENSIRYILSKYGVLVSGFDSDGIQDEHNLNSLLYQSKLKEILGEDLVFDLQGLLVERFGSNLRNQMAHGLINDYGFYSYTAEYAWWLILQICCRYKIATLETTRKYKDS